MKTYKKLDKCLCCGNKNLIKFLDLKEQPLANNLVQNTTDDYYTFPLVVNYCSSCWHSQLSISVDPEILFRDYYYVTGTSNTMHEYCEKLAKILHSKINKEDISILDVASNDGTFLDKFNQYGWNLFGIDPAENLQHLSKKKGIKTYVNFFGVDDVKFDRKFDVITALNVFAHVANPLKFLKECYSNLSKDGVIVIQTSQRDMIEKRQFDTVYHEHISFFSLKSMETICSNAGLFINDVYLPDIHGGSYVFFISKEDKKTNNVNNRMAYEQTCGRYSDEIYSTFQENISSLEYQLKENLKDKKTIGFGAAAKGVVAIHALNLDIDFIVDENPLKVGKMLPERSIPIRGIESLNTKEDLNIVVLPWNFKKEITEKIQTIRGHRDNIVSIFELGEKK